SAAAPMARPMAHPVVHPEADAVREPDPASGPLIETLRALWSAELDVEPAELDPGVGFFAAGGHSISAVRLLNRVREALGVEYPLLEGYQRPTIADMARH